MKARNIALIVFALACVGCLIIVACSDIPSSRPVLEAGPDSYADGIIWIRVNSPRDGLRCWVAEIVDDLNGFVSYCEEGP